MHINVVAQAASTPYAVILDRISHDVPFYRAYLKNAALNGAVVLNDPFLRSADDKFFPNSLAEKLGVAVPHTVILPSHERPADCSPESFGNLAYPLDWKKIFAYIGWPAYIKPHAVGTWDDVCKVRHPDEFFKAYAGTGQRVMLLQSEITFDDYFRCCCIGEDVLIMPYEPRNPHHLRYAVDRPALPKTLLDRVRADALKLNRALGYDFNTVEFAIHDGVPYAIDFCNPAPDADRASVGEKNFNWIVDATARVLVKKARAHIPDKSDFSRDTFALDFAGHGSR